MGIGAVVVAAATITTISAGPAEPVAQPAHHECARATQRCDGQISVPLNWADPGSARISVSFAWIPRRDKTRPATGTVLTVHGGPTAAVPAAELYQRALGGVLDRQNMLIIDPRGLGGSTPLLCPSADTNRPETIAGCARRLEPRLPFFTSEAAVADFDAVRAALGVPAVSVYGSSYGTVWGHAYATRFPDRTRAVLLDSVVHIGPDGYLRWPLGRPVHPDLANLDSVCEPSRSCRALPGEPRRVWADLVVRLRARPDPEVPTASLLRLPQQATEPVVGRELNAAAVAYLAGDPLPLRRLVRGFAGGGASAQPPAGPDPTLAGYLAYVCGDAAFPYRRDASPAQRKRELDAAYAIRRPFEPFTAAEVLGTGGGQNDWCVNWPTPRPSPPVPPGARYPAVPMLATGGQLDPVTPVANAIELAGRFPRGSAVEHRFGGHTPALGAAAGFTGTYWTCTGEAMRSFLHYPHRSPRTGCSAENYRATGSFPVTAGDVARAPIPGFTEAEHTAVGAAIATVRDAVTRRNPNGPGALRSTTEPGLRGGTVRFPDRNTVLLDRVRFVSDVDTTGRVSLSGEDRATAAVTVTRAGDRPRRLELDWRPFSAARSTPVSGILDGHRFHVTVPS